MLTSFLPGKQSKPPRGLETASWGSPAARLLDKKYRYNSVIVRGRPFFYYAAEWRLNLITDRPNRRPKYSPPSLAPTAPW